MKKNKNKKIVIIFIIILLTILFGVGFFYILNNNSKLMMKEIYLNKWDNLGARYLICRANIIGELGINFSECRVSFESNSDKIDMINTNKKDYLGEITYYDENIIRQASLFYSENNYYVLYYDEQNEFFTIENCYMVYFMDDMLFYIPSPVPIEISYEVFDVYHQFNKNGLDYIFDNYSFENAVKFYGRISEEFVSIDKESQQITLNGNNVNEGKIVEKCLTLDFKNKTVIVLRADGSKIELDGTETMEEIE